jgi:hypothetical protein
VRKTVGCLFGATAQVVVGCLMVLATTLQTIWWSAFRPPTVRAVFLVSMEALYFAAYSVIAVGMSVIWLNNRTPDA